jgi:hypothetical protein
MPVSALSLRSGVPVPTVNRILRGGVERASFANVSAIALALGMPVTFGDGDAAEIDAFARRQARTKAEWVVRQVQGTSALESQAVDPVAYERMVEDTTNELLRGSRRRLWSA